MFLTKFFKDRIRKSLLGDSVPRELLELYQYFVHNDPITFTFHKENGEIVAESLNFRFGSIITAGKSREELDTNIKDAILTAFGVPAVYQKEADIKSTARSQNKEQYAIA